MRCAFAFLLLIALSTQTAVSPFASAQIGAPPLPTDTALDAHPRLLITNAYIDNTLVPKTERDTPTWQRLRSYVDSAAPEQDFATNPAAATRSLAIAYLMTGEAEYARRATLGLLQMVDYVASHPVLDQPAVWDEQFLDYVAEIAVGYDWLYDTFSPTDRAALVDVMIAAGQVLMNPAKDNGRAYWLMPDRTFRFRAYDHWGMRLVWAVTATGLALLGEEPAAAELLDYGRSLFLNWIIPALDDQSGGGLAEGGRYAFSSAWGLAQTATALWTAQAENTFDDTAWWYDHLPYIMYAALPSLHTARLQPDAALFWGYPVIGGRAERFSDAALLRRATGLLLATIFDGTDYAAWMRWYANQPDSTGKIPTLEGPFSGDAFLWADPSATAFPPFWRMWYVDGVGQAFMRSGWGTLADDTTVFITFNAGDRYAENQFFDSGHLQIFRGDDALLVRAGNYADGGDHDVNFFGRSIAANTLLICDLSENFDEILPNPTRDVWLNDCGQRRMSPAPPSAINPFFRADFGQAYETGTVLRFAEEGNVQYFRANLTPAYNNTRYSSEANAAKVSDVLRELVYLRPNILLVHDRIMPTNPETKPLALFHFNSRPSLQPSRWYRVEVGNSALHVRGMIPQHSVDVIEGFEVAGESIPPIGNRFETMPSGGFRLQFQTTENQTIHHLLSAFYIDGANQPPPEAAYVAGEGMHGVALANWQVMFDQTPENITRATIPVQNNIQNLLLTGLTPLGAYRVDLPDGSVEVLSADDAGTLYLFMTQSGELRIRTR